MRIPYRTRQTLGRFGMTLLVILVAALVVWMCWVVWLERYVIYSRDGATLDLGLSAEGLTGEIAVEPDAGETVAIYINEGSNVVDVSTELTRISGYYADEAALKAGIDTVRSQIEKLATSVPVMLDVKNWGGSLFYTSEVGPVSTDVDAEAMDQLISDLVLSDRYLIARLPAFRDRDFGLNNVDCGLFLPSGLGLWMDDEGYYWLDPASSGTVNYLTRIVEELRSLGFDEVVFTEFHFPVSSDYAYTGDQYAVLLQAADLLVSSCTTDSFAVSFAGNKDFPLPEGRSRLYLSNVDAVEVESVMESFSIETPEIRLVMMADSSDTRYEICSVMRPLSAAH